MKWHQKVTQASHHCLQKSLSTGHGRIVLCGLFVGLCYFPVWLSDLVIRALQGSTGLLMLASVVALGSQELWKHRKALQATIVSEEDRLLGHVLILAGTVLFPFCRFEIWSQALIWLIVLAGIACSSWGVSFFRKYPLLTFLFGVSVYPQPGIAARVLWETFTPPAVLENFMAWSGSLVLRMIGQPAVAQGAIVSLPQGAVEVAWGCNGFNMAFAMGTAGLLLGIFLKKSWQRTLGLVVVGIILALIFNVPRIVLLAMSSVYWGKESFKFWHGPWGGQIFVGILFTVYYYLAMWLASWKPALLDNQKSGEK